jgi:hypothetical protein
MRIGVACAVFMAAVTVRGKGWRGCRDLILRLLAPGPTCAARGETDGRVVSDAIEPRTLGGISTKSWKRRPEGQRDLLKQVVALPRIPGVGMHQASQRREILPERRLVGLNVCA